MNNPHENSELFHYTGLAGLEGIVGTQTLWATHFAYLNDVTELKTFDGRLVKMLRKELAVRDEDDTYPEDMTTAMHNTAIRIAEPHIASFCKPATPNISKHGLLSQWRAYGEEGGYAVIFDEPRLKQMLKKEEEKWLYTVAIIGDVVYSTQLEQFQIDLGAPGAKIVEILRKFKGDNTNEKLLEDLYIPYMQCAGFYKHWGFEEEKEYRILAIPFGKKIVDDKEGRKHKPRNYFSRRGTPVPCIHLFDGIASISDNPLPITRIIIGPHRHKENRLRAVENLLDRYGLDIPVTVSDIPFVGHY